MKYTYLDHAATTPVRKEVLKAMMPYFSETFGNPLSIHRFGAEALEAVEIARGKIAKTINAKPDEIIFTSGGTEADNLAVKGVAYAKVQQGKNIITSPIEHEAVGNSCRYLAEHGFDISYLPVDVDGRVSAADARAKITPKTVLVTIMHANNEIGTVQPIEDIFRIAGEKGVITHADAVQTYGALPIDVKAMRADLLSMSSHKIYGPKGIGALYVREGVDIVPMMHGKGQEKGKRAGTLNVPAIVGFSVAAELAVKEMKKESKRQTKMRDFFINHITDAMKGIKLNGHPTKRLPNNINLSFDGITGDEIIKELGRHGVAVSTSSNSNVLRIIGVSGEKATGSVRITLGRETTEKDARHVMAMLQKLVENARKRY